jgi:hypothetical protein
MFSKVYGEQSVEIEPTIGLESLINPIFKSQ